jgi:hypothetical protein
MPVIIILGVRASRNVFLLEAGDLMAALKPPVGPGLCPGRGFRERKLTNSYILTFKITNIF